MPRLVGVETAVGSERRGHPLGEHELDERIEIEMQSSRAGGLDVGDEPVGRGPNVQTSERGPATAMGPCR